MIEQLENEERIAYLVRVLHEFMKSTIAGEQTIGYDGAICDGHCLAQDLADELGVDINEF